MYNPRAANESAINDPAIFLTDSPLFSALDRKTVAKPYRIT
jgi:hypothetical protein